MRAASKTLMKKHLKFVSLLIVASLTFIIYIDVKDNSMERLEEFPKEISGIWVYRSGGEQSVCEKIGTVIKDNTFIFIKRCADGENNIMEFNIKSVLVNRYPFSNNIREYHLLTEGPNVVFDLFNDGHDANIFMQFWITDDYGPTKKLGVFSKRRSD